MSQKRFPPPVHWSSWLRHLVHARPS